MVRASLLLGSAVLAAAPAAVLAQDATWLANPVSNQFNTPGNWTAGVPTGTATFGSSTTTAISLAPGGVTVGGFQFDAGAPAYSFTGTSGLTFNGTGIVNNSSNAPSISMTGANITFTNTASGGNAQLIVNAGANLNISGLTSAGTSVGSIEGVGGVALGTRQLTTGGNNLSTTMSGTISGGGSLIKDGSGTLSLTGANTYTGGTTISGGTLQVGDGGTTGTITGNVTNNAALRFNRSDTLTVAGTISGTGTLTQSGAGTTHLTSDNSFSGTTTISAGTLQLGSTQASGATTGSLGSGDVVNNASLVVHRQNANTISGSISGTGTLTNTGVGTVTLLGNNSYSGTTTITSGTVQIGSGGTAGTLGSGNVVNNSIFTGLLFNRSDTMTVANTISGTGGLTQGGSGTTILTGANSYVSTTISAGTLQIGNGGATGTLGTGNVVNNAGTLAFNRSDDITIANAISGTGSLSKLGTNTLVLTGNNTSTGGTTISGGTLQAGNGGTTGGIGSGATTNNGSLVFNRSNNLVVSSAISGSGTFTKLGAGMLELTGNSTYTGTTTISAGILAIGAGGASGAIAGDIVNNAQLFIARNNAYTYAGSISGTGSMSITDSGPITLTGASTHSGGTTISAGTLQIGGGGTTGSIAGNITNNGALRFNRSDSLTLAGVVSGSGTLTQAGTGTAILTGANTYTGLTTISAGTLQIGAGSTTGTLGTGNVANSGVLAFNRSNSLTYAGAVSGTGSLTQAGSGTTILTGANSYSGTTTISSGTLQVGNGGANGTLGTGSVANSGTLAFSRSGALTVSNAISGTGGLSKLGTNTLTLTGANTYSGTTTISGGTLEIGNGGTTGALGSGATVNSGTLQFNRSDTMTVASSISGTGSIVQAGTGTTILTGTNTYTGTTTVNAGRLQVGTGGSLAGNIVNNAAITFDSSSDTTYSSAISGTGSLTHSGSGTTTLSGTNTYSGGTTVSAGRLVVNGSIASNVTVGSGGNLGGSGTIAGSVTNNGTLAPGNSIGTLTVNGSYTQAAGSTYQVEVNAAGQSDRINVTGAPGTATINGGTVQVVAAAGTYGRSTTYTILNATGGVTGTYSSVTSNFAFLTPSLSYDANNVFLTLLLSQNAFASGARTSNQRAVGTALDQTSGSASGDYSTVINALAGLSTAQGPAALDAISGQQYSAFGTANLASGVGFMNVVAQQMSAARGGFGQGKAGRTALAEACEVACEAATPGAWSTWVSALGGTGSVDGNGNSATVTFNSGGAAAGIDYRVDSRFLVGLALGYASGNQWLDGFTGRGTSDSYQASVYGSFTHAAFYADALLGYGYNDNQMTRTIVIPGLQPRTATGRTGANQFLGQLEAGYRFPIHDAAAATLTPFVRLQASSVNQAAFTENGASALNLGVAQQTTSSVRSVLGAELAGAFDLGWREKLALQLRLGWVHEYADTSRPVTAGFAGAPGSSFTVYGAAPQRDSAVIGLAADTAVSQGTSLYLRYDGEIAATDSSHAFSAGLRMRW